MRELMHCCRYLLGLDSPATQVTDREVAILLHHARTASVIVEIGTFEGKTAIALAQATPGKVFSIDPFFSGRLGIGYGEVIARAARRRAGVHNLKYIKDFSYHAASRFDLPVEMIFIDADHSYDGVRRDWIDWTAKLKVGGVVAMHDSRIARNSPVRLGSMEFFEREVATNKDYELIDGADALVVLRRLR